MSSSHPSPFWVLSLQRPDTHRQILKQGELFASVLEQRRNEDLSQPLGEAEWGCQSGKTSWRKTRQSRRRRVSQTKENATKSSEQKRASPSARHQTPKGAPERTSVAGTTLKPPLPVICIHPQPSLLPAGGTSCTQGQAFHQRSQLCPLYLLRQVASLSLSLSVLLPPLPWISPLFLYPCASPFLLKKKKERKKRRKGRGEGNYP